MKFAFLEDFTPEAHLDEPSEIAAAEAEETKLVAFEQGYSAGWEDAIAAQSENTRVATQEFAKTISDISFTYHEAVAHVQKELIPVLDAILTQIVPQTLDASFIGLVIEKLNDIALERAEVPVLVTCSPYRRVLLEQTLSGIAGVKVRLMTDPAFAQDAVSLGFDESESHMDLSDIAEHLVREVEAYSHSLGKDVTHGSK